MLEDTPLFKILIKRCAYRGLGYVACLGMPMTGTQTFPLPSINDFLTLKQCSADSDHHKESLIRYSMRRIHTNTQQLCHL